MMAAISSTRSPRVRLAGRVLTTASPLPSFIARRAFLPERGDALGEIWACPYRVAKLLLHGFAGQRVIGDRGADLPLDRLYRRWAVRGNHLRRLDRPAHQLARWYQPIYQAQ